MQKYLFMERVLATISKGEFFRKAFAMALRVLAVVIFLAGLVGWIMAWKTVTNLRECPQRS